MCSCSTFFRSGWSSRAGDADGSRAVHALDVQSQVRVGIDQLFKIIHAGDRLIVDVRDDLVGLQSGDGCAAAHLDARDHQARSLFIETVLSGVSAGVIDGLIDEGVLTREQVENPRELGISMPRGDSIAFRLIRAWLEGTSELR